MSLPIGERLGPYAIGALLGAGGMGEVYRARDTRLGRDVAIKVLPAGVAEDASRLARFEQEARAAAALNHPNITALYDIGTFAPADSSDAAKRCPYLVTELLQGATLRDRLSSGAVPVRKALDWAQQIALGLAAAHDKGIVHRDLKPENIFITVDDRVKILDFGLAKLTEADSAALSKTASPTVPPATVAGMVLGTAGYMAPEQVRGVAADHRADLFAFGAVLYEMLSGRRAFPGETTMDVMMAVAREEAPSLASLRPDLPPTLMRLVERCLEKDPDARFQSTRDLAFALEGSSTRTSSESPAPSSAGMARVEPRRRMGGWLWAIGGITIGAIVTGLPGALRPAPINSTSKALTLTLPSGFPMFRLPGVFSASSGFWSPSPDSRWLLGVQLLPDGRTSFVLSELATGTERPLRVTAGNVSVINSAWAPDSKSFAYWDATDGLLKRIAIDTGVVARIGLFRDVRAIGWGPDGLVFANLAEEGTGLGLFAISPNGGDAIPIAKQMRWPSVLPSGRVVASSFSDPRGLTLLNPKTGERRLLLQGVEPAGYMTGHVLYNEQRKLVAHRLDETAGALVGEPIVIGDAADLRVYASDMLLSWVASDEPGGTLQPGGPLAWVNRSGQRMRVPGDTRPNGGATLAMRDNLEAATTVFGPGSNGADVVTIRLDTGAVTRVFAQTSWDAQPRWSRDGRRLVFRSDRALMIADVASASPPTAVVKSIPGLERVDDWSANGRHVLVSVVTTETRYDILQVDLQAGGELRPFAATPATESFARFSPDGTHVAYVSDTTGPPEVYVQAFPAGSSRRVSLSGGTLPKWSRDGSRLYFFSPDGWIMEAAVTRPGGDISVGTPQRVAPGSGSDFEPSSDGQRFLVIEEPPRRSVALVNWRSLLPR